MDADTARLLLAEGLDLLAELGPYDEASALTIGTRLRATHDPALVAAVLAQAELRQRARSKFGESAHAMLFTRDGLEQATRADVADRHAARFASAGIGAAGNGAPDSGTVHDLGCGLGADALAFARAGLAVDAVDADEATALLAHHNLTTLHPESAAGARHARAEDVDLAGAQGVWLDPARRTPGRTDATGRTRRTFRLDELAPSWEFVCAAAERVPATGAKLSPAFPHASIPPGCEAEWVSTGGDLVECAMWWGPLAQHPGRVATLLRDGAEPVQVTEADAADAPPAGELDATPGGYVYEPDLAVLQAGLVGALAAAVDGSELSPGVGYVAADRAADVPFARRHQVVEVLPAQAKAVKGWLRREGITGLTIKRRGGRLDPDEFRRKLGLSTRGGDQATLLLTVGPSGPLALVLS